LPASAGTSIALDARKILRVGAAATNPMQRSHCMQKAAE
jgi:hypothetical protein